jgi:cellulose synthase/poly-beta-1,6-N-acetylglucosamine synthase-like glycosyltransferase
MQFALMILAWLMAVPLSIILIYLTAEIAAGLMRSSTSAISVTSGNLSGVILVPAHNEASSIGATVEALQFSAPDCRILVVADNCTDETASLARRAGAETVIRSDPEHRGKGFALAYGRDFLAKDPPDAVVVIDAACRLSKGSMARLVDKAVTSGEPVQSVNLLERTEVASPLVDISNFAMLVKNLVRARGLAQMGGGVLLFGTGMAFPWRLFARLDLATSNAVEDIELGLALARLGVKVSFEDGALVTSPAASIADSKGQRSRWEHGFLQAAAHNGLPLLLSGLRQRSRHLVAIGAHMLVPPLAMLMLLSIFMIFGVSIISFWSGYFVPLLVLMVSFLAAITILIVAWWREGRDVITYKSLMRIPFYILWKIPIYLGFFTSRQTGWNRTRRDGEKP